MFMTESNFPFIEDQILRQNIDEAFNHIITLLPFTESITYNETAKSAFRKTIIIYTASVVEALLFYSLNTKISDTEIADFYSSWELINKKVLHTIDNSREIVAGDYVKVLGKVAKDKMNLGQISDILKNKKILNQSLFDRVDKIRILRNEQHIGTHKVVKKYTKNDLEEAFSIAHDIKEFAKELK